MSTKNLNEYISLFLEMMKVERGASKNTIESYQIDLAQLNSTFLSSNNSNPFLDFQTPEEISLDSLKAYVKQLHVEYSISTISRKISSIKQFFEFLTIDGYIKANPARLLTLPKKQKQIPKFLTESELEVLMDIAEQEDDLKDALRLKLIVSILSGSGLRVSELISLKLNSIQKAEAEGQNLYFFDIIGKGDKQRIAPINNKTKELLMQYVPMLEHKSGYLFPSIKAVGKHITRQQIANLLKALARKANFDEEKVSAHILRHSFATKILNNGMDLKSLQEILGHSDISTTQIYTHLNAPKLKKFVEQHHPLANKKNTTS